MEPVVKTLRVDVDKLYKLGERIKRLEEALRPFADDAPKWGEYVDDEPLVEGWSDGPDSTLMVADLRRARAALEDK